MSQVHDIFVRAHTLPIDKPRRRRKGKRKNPKRKSKSSKWWRWAVVFDCESRIDAGQQLTFGFYRVLELKDGSYSLHDEGAFYDDGLPCGELQVLSQYCQTTDTEVRAFPPDFPLYSRSEFVTKIFYKYARKGALIVGFNLGFDLTRLARKWPEGEKNEWSLALVEYPNGTENLHYPRVLIDQYKKVAPQKYHTQLRIDRLQRSINEKLAAYEFWPYVNRWGENQWTVMWRARRAGARGEIGEVEVLEILLNLARNLHVSFAFTRGRRRIHSQPGRALSAIARILCARSGSELHHDVLAKG
jgi:hypothetical protein